jgi:hypothetical protein
MQGMYLLEGTSDGAATLRPFGPRIAAIPAPAAATPSPAGTASIAAAAMGAAFLPGLAGFGGHPSAAAVAAPAAIAISVRTVRRLAGRCLRRFAGEQGFDPGK